jgi:(1->4)-alpha-D-glucan 1-alpha-D-glucosylmutase
LSLQQATGLRIDHPDGLWDPPAYFLKLQESYLLHCLKAVCPVNALSDEGLTREVSHWCEQQRTLSRGEQAWPLYMVVEKTLSEGEALPRDWAVYGTTGYDFLGEVNRLLTDASHERQFDRIYDQFTAAGADFKRLANSCKKMIMLVAMAGEINVLARRLDRISEKDRRYRDFTLNSLTHAIREVIACLPVHRTYTTALSGPSQWDQRAVEIAVADARKQNPRTAHAIFDFIATYCFAVGKSALAPGLVEFVMKFQQLTGAVAKGVGDTSYIYNRLVSLNEVGGRPQRFGAEVDLPSLNEERLKNCLIRCLPHPHDTKRSEDVRARIQVLSKSQGNGRQHLHVGAGSMYHRIRLNGSAAPDRSDEYLLYKRCWERGGRSAMREGCSCFESGF